MEAQLQSDPSTNSNFTCIKNPPGAQSKTKFFTNKIPTSAQEITPGRGTEFEETDFLSG